MKRKLVGLLATLLSGFLLAAAFAPFEWTALAWVALIPLLAVWEGSKGLSGAWWIYPHTMILFVVGCWWMTEVSGLGLAVTTFHLGFFQLVAALPIVAGRTRWNLPYLATVPIAWVAAEYTRTFLLTGFAWLYLGHTQWEAIPLIQVSDLTGAYGVSFVIAAVNAGLFDLWLAFRKGALRPALIRIALPVALLLAGTLGYGAYRLSETSLRPGPRLALIQASIPQSLKLDGEPLSQDDIMNRHLRLSLEAIESPSRPDAVVWPETMVPGYLDANVEFRAQLTDLAARKNVRLLIGSNSFQLIPGPSYRKTNSCFDISRQGEILGRYEKSHLVPVGEYNPYEGILPRTDQIIYQTAGFLPDLSPGGSPYRGTLTRRDTGESFGFGVIICFEEIFPALVREICDEKVDSLVLVSNDAWWNDSSEYEQFLAIGVFRAIENRVGLARAGNTGISCFIDPVGRLCEVLEQDGRRKNIEGFLTAEMLVDDRRSPYATLGDTFARTCLALSALLVFLPRTWLRRPKP